MKKTILLLVVSIMICSSVYAQTISQQWHKTYGGIDHETLASIQQTSDGGYVLSGNTASFGTGLYSILVLKLDANGEITWQRVFSGNGFLDSVYAIQQTSDGGFVLGGGTFVGNNDMDALILKLDSNGDILWSKSYQEVIEFKSIQQTSDGGYIACGYNSILKVNANGDGSWHYVIPENYPSFRVDLYKVQQTTDGGYIVSGNLINDGNYDCYVLKLDSNGNLLWQKTYGGSGAERGIVHQTSIGEYFITGYTKSIEDDRDAWILKLNSTGEVLWQKTFGGIQGDIFVDIQKNPDGEYLVGGYTESFGAGSDDLWILRLDNNGNILWQKTYGGSGTEVNCSIHRTPDGGCVVLSQTNTFGAGERELWVLKLDSNGNISDCPIIGSSDAIVSETAITAGVETSFLVVPDSITLVNPNISLQSSLVETSIGCYYENPTDIDGDGVANNFNGTMANSSYSTSFLADEDNCPNIANGPFLGTCTVGNVGDTCITNDACGIGGICSMNQEDTDGDGIGDVCDSSTEQIPTLSEWGMIIFMFLILGISVVMLYRRREI